jgi:hypothetical protein
MGVRIRASRAMTSAETRARAIRQIRDALQEFAAPDWDGEGALAASARAAQNAVLLIRALPAGLPEPEICVEPDGGFSLDWARSQRSLISVSVGESDRLAVAWLHGDASGHGVEHFDGASVPDRILQGIERVMVDDQFTSAELHTPQESD